MVGYQALAAVLGVPFALDWRRDPSCDVAFEELFQAPAPLPGARDGADAQAFTWSPWFVDIWRRFLGDRCDRARFGAHVRRALQALTPAAAVAARLEALGFAAGLRDAVGVHVRWTDNLAMYGWFEQHDPGFARADVSTLEGFLAAMDRFVAERPVFLATDNPEVEARCLRRYGRRLLTAGKPYAQRGLRTSPVTEALVDLLLLRSCGHVVGTYYSSFSQFAAVWGGASYSEIVGESRRPNAYVNDLIAMARGASAAG